MPTNTQNELVLVFRIDAIERRSEQIYRAGSGSSAQFESADLGWFARCGRVSFALGADPGGWSVGDILELRKRARNG